MDSSFTARGAKVTPETGPQRCTRSRGDGAAKQPNPNVLADVLILDIRVETALVKTEAINSLGACDEKSACSRKSILLAAGDVGV
jgi:hypothetical protein